MRTMFFVFTQALFWLFPFFAGYVLGDWSDFDLSTLDAAVKSLQTLGPYFGVWFISVPFLAGIIQFCRPEDRGRFENVDGIMAQKDQPTSYGDLHSSMALHPFKFIRYQGYTFCHVVWSAWNFSFLGFVLFRTFSESNWEERWEFACSLYFFYVLMRILREWVPGNGDFWARQSHAFCVGRGARLRRFLCLVLSFWKGGYEGRYFVWHCLCADTERVQELSRKSVFGHIISLLARAWNKKDSSPPPLVR